MGFDNLKQKVIEESEKEKQAVLDEARKKAEEIKKQAEEEVNKQAEELLEDAQKQAEQLEKQRIASRNLDIKKEKLKTQKEMMNKVFDQTRKQFSEKMSEEEIREFLNGLLEKANQKIKVHKVLCSESDIELIDFPNKEKADIAGGIIAENKDGTVRLDFSLETLLTDIKQSYLDKVTRKLFT